MVIETRLEEEINLNNKTKILFSTLSQDILNNHLRKACELDKVEVVQYLLTSSDLENCADVHAYNDLAFKRALRKGSMNVIEYLILDYGIEKTQVISDTIEGLSEVAEEETDKVIKMFEIKKLDKKLATKSDKEKLKMKL